MRLFQRLALSKNEFAIKSIIVAVRSIVNFDCREGGVNIINRIRYELNLVLATRLIKKAGKSDRSKADRRYAAALKRFASAISINPQSPDAFKHWGHGIYMSAAEKPVKEKMRLYQTACEKYRTSHILDSGDYETLKLWGFALRRLAHNKREKNPDSLFQEVFEKFSKAVEIQPAADDVFYHWGLTLFERTLKYNGKNKMLGFQKACEKFSQANSIKDGQAKVLNDWGTAQMELAKLSPDPERIRGLDTAKEKFDRANRIEPGIASYNLACLCSLKGNDLACREHLQTAHEQNRLPSLGHLEHDADLNNVRKSSWFKELATKVREGKP